MKTLPTQHIERRMLCVAARPRRSTLMQQAIRDLATQSLDWASLARMALGQRVYPAVYANLSSSCPDAVPPEVLSTLQRQAHVHAGLGITLAGELTHLLDLLETHGIRALPLKGPTLAQVAYGGLTQRVYHDLDLLIEPGGFEKTESLLHAQGYTSQYDFDDRRKALFLRLENGLPFVHNERPITLDLHVRLGPPRYSFAPDFEALWTRSQIISLGGNRVRIPSMEDLLQIVCWHGAKHQWIILKFVGDVAELIEAAPGLDWDAVRRQAQHHHATRMLHIGLRLAHDVLEAELPPEVLREVNRNPQDGRLAAQLVPGLFAEHIKQASYFQRHAFQWHMRDTTSSKLHYALSTLTFNKLSRRLLLGALIAAPYPQQKQNGTTSTNISVTPQRGLLMLPNFTSTVNQKR